MDDRMKNVLLSLSSEWRVFAHSTGLNAHIIGYIDLHDLSDQLKMEFFLRELVTWHPSCFMTLIENSLSVMEKVDVLEELKSFRKHSALSLFFPVFGLFINSFYLICLCIFFKAY